MYNNSISEMEWNENLQGQRPTKIRNVPPFAQLSDIVPSPFMLCVRQKLNNTVDLTNVGMLACYPEQLFGSHRLNRGLRYVNDLGDEPFGYEEIDDDEASYLRTQGVPRKTLEFLLS